MAPRLHFFYGTDNRASLAEVHRWVQLFHQKYGQTTHYTIEADELTPEEVVRQLSQNMIGQSLFPEPKLVLLKRLATYEAKRTSGLKLVTEYLSQKLADQGEEITIVLWEERDLAPTKPLLTTAKEWEKKGLAKLQQFQVPEGKATTKKRKKKT